MRCTAVSDAGHSDVYCLTVPATHSFAIESGLIVHNCLEYILLAFGPTVSQKKTAADPVVERRYVDPVSMKDAWMA